MKLIIFLGWLMVIPLFSRGVDIIQNIEDNNADSIIYFLEQGNDIDGIYPRHTLLETAIRFNQIDIVELLIDHQANVNLQNNQTTPLFISVIYGQHYQSNEIIALLVDRKADLDFVGLNGLTPFVLACKIKNSPAAKLLYEKGADPGIRDQLGKDFFYYVLRGNDPSLVSFFVSKGFEIPRMSSLKDGPYVIQRTDDSLEVNYMQYDSITDRAEWIPVNLDQERDDKMLVEAIGFQRKKNDTRNNFEFRKAEKIFVVSDIHGHFDSFIKLLKANKIIDENLAWAWGKGHLVINGDVFDRGAGVTECLWLIFKLEYQAEKSGGRVHYLLGNHELMILKDNDKSYVHDKYILPFAKAGMDYHDLFSWENILGQWLRSKKIVVKINNLLFVHGGIPPGFVDKQQTLEKMNQSIHDYLADTSGIVLYANDLIIEPTWYRGYFEQTSQEEDINKVCKYYKVEKIIVGHTPVKQIMTLQGGLVVGVGIHFGEPGKPAEGLLIRDHQFYRLDEKGKQVAL
ncbi:MAG: metallophosphoesterase [Cyclobacteriaceae bacterium]|nr:metallophosphoesterase [Cyclobacteriaceae bacterium]